MDPFVGSGAPSGSVNHEHLKTFLTVAAEGSFSRAAKLRHMSQSTASLHVRQLEEALDTRLLERDPVRPTAAGRVLIDYGGRLLGLQQEAADRVRACEEPTRRRLSIAACELGAVQDLPPLLARLREAHPDVLVVVTSCGSDEALAAIRSGACDLAVVGHEPRDDDLGYRMLAEHDLVLVAAAHLDDETIGRMPIVRHRCLDGGFGSLDDREAGITLDSLDGVRRCVLAGAGVALLPLRLVADDLAARRLREAPWSGGPLRRVSWVAHLGVSRPTGPAGALLDQLGA